MSVLLAACIVIAMHDGDTLTVKCTQRVRPLVIRVLGIDAPEFPAFTWGLQPGAKDALAEAKKVCPVGGKADIRLTKFDSRTKRWIAGVQCNLVDLSTDLVETGNAWCYMAPKASDYCALQQAAKDQRVGIWSVGAPPAVPPNVWRHNSMHTQP